MKSTPQNTAVVTLAAYRTIPKSAQLFFESAERHGVKVVRFGVGTTFASRYDYYHEKVTMLRQHIASLPSDVKFVLYTDSRDCLFLRGLDVICDEFNRRGRPILMSSERGCWPHRDPGWMDRFPRSHFGFNFPCAGTFMAEREALNQALLDLDLIQQEVIARKLPSAEPACVTDDQFLWQCAYVFKRASMALDFEQSVFHVVSDDMDSVDFPTCGETFMLKNGSQPAIIHFSGQRSIALPMFDLLMKMRKLSEL